MKLDNARALLKRWGWRRQDRAIGPNEPQELWVPPHSPVGMQPLPVQLKTALRRERIKITQTGEEE